MNKSELKHLIKEEIEKIEEGRFSSETNSDFDEYLKYINDVFAHLDKLNKGINHPTFQNYSKSQQDRLIEKSVELEDKLMGILDGLNKNSPLSDTQIYTLRDIIINGFEKRDK